MPRVVTLASVALLLTTSGCSTISSELESLNPFAPKYVVADAENPVVEVACIWQPGEGRNAKGLPARGFAGQVFFFTRKNAEPALVDGTVRVYLFADRGTAEERGKPLCEFDVPSEIWATYATMTALGPGYSIFVPYPQVEPYQVRCQLRIRFTPRHGLPIWSEAVTMVLDGPPRPGQEPLAWADPEVQSLANTVNRIDVTRQRGTPAELRSADSQSRNVRQLRTDTIHLGDLQQIAYEAPPRRKPVSKQETDPANRAPVQEQSRRPASGDAPHPLSEGSATSVTHPLDGSVVGRSVHPIETAVTSPAEIAQPAPLQPRPIGDSTAINEMRRGRRVQPSRLELARHAAHEYLSTRDAADGESAPGTAKSMAGNVETPPARPVGGRLRTPLRSPVYGVWQPIEE